MRITSIIKPSTRPIDGEVFPKNKVAIKKVKMTAQTMENGKSRRMVSRSMEMGLMTALRPATTNKLKMLDPMTLPVAISSTPFKEAVMLTQASGKLVPMETMVKPMIMVGTRNIFAKSEAPPTNQSAPLISSKKPSAKKMMVNNNEKTPFFCCL